jgi:CubicO group peptidase (beta-lactamase class C family)
MRLCEKGTIDLDTPLVKYTSKKFIEEDARLNNITARLILSHRTRFQNWRSSAEPLKINFDPGSDFMYSGEGYFYLQSVITELIGKTDLDNCGSYEADLKVCATDIGEYFAQNILAPFNMKSGSYIWTKAVGETEARPHDTNEQPNRSISRIKLQKIWQGMRLQEDCLHLQMIMPVSYLSFYHRRTMTPSG